MHQPHVGWPSTCMYQAGVLPGLMKRCSVKTLHLTGISCARCSAEAAGPSLVAHGLPIWLHSCRDIIPCIVVRCIGLPEDCQGGLHSFQASGLVQEAVGAPH